MKNRIPKIALKISGIIFFTIYTTSLSFSQLMTNNGASIFSSTGALIYVDGEIINQNNGTFDNSGDIELTGDWTNNAGNDAFINSSPGSVQLIGGLQLIQGTDATRFNDLIVTGSNTKTQLIDAYVESILDLTDQELATDSFTMFVENPSTTTINRVTGFVSSLKAGGLSREMNVNQTYLFPVGSSIGIQRYRPIELTPSTSSVQSYKVRMANEDATVEGYDRSINDSTFCVINGEYYHRIYQTTGSDPADVSIFFDDAIDNNYENIAHWQNQPRWENTGAVTITNQPSPTLSFITLSNWNDFTQPSFALATTTPVVALTSNDTSICQGDTILFTASGGFANYEFFNNSISVQNGPSPTFLPGTITSGDTIRVTASDTACTAFSNEIVVTVTVPPSITTTTATITDESCGNSDGSITGITATGTAPLTYQWVNGSSTTVGGDSANVMNLPPDTYTLTVTEANGCTSTAGPFTIISEPAVQLDTSSISLTLSTCGASNGSITGILVSNGTSPFTYDWVDVSTNSVGSSLDLSNVPANAYTLTVTDANGCTSIVGPFAISDIGAPTLDALGLVIDTSECTTATGSISGLQVTGGTLPYTYQWDDPGSQTTIDASILAPGTYTLSVTDSAGCTLTAGPYTVSSYPIPSAPFAASVGPLCEGDPIPDLTAIGSGGTLTWYVDAGLTTIITTGDTLSLAAASDTSFWVTETINGCESPATQVNVLFAPAPSPPVAGTNATYCFGETYAELTATGTSIQWWEDDILTQLLDSGNALTISPEIGTNVYYVTQILNGCLSLADTVTIIVNPLPIAGSNTILCTNVDPSAYLDTASALPAGGSWSSPSTAISPHLSSDGYLDHENISWGNYYPIVYTYNGCSDTLLVNISGAAAGPDTTICPNTSTFMLPPALPLGGSWTSPDAIGSSSIVDPVTGEVDKSGLEGTIPFVYSNQGCPDTVLVTVCGENIVFVPNIFSPTSSNENNNKLQVFGDNVDWLIIKIFDRWGEFLYESKSTEEAMNFGWDGTKGGEPLSPQVFVYYLEGAFLDGETFFKQGSITSVK